jgi:hypothetical protein
LIQINLPRKPRTDSPLLLPPSADSTCQTVETRSPAAARSGAAYPGRALSPLRPQRRERQPPDLLVGWWRERAGLPEARRAYPQKLLGSRCAPNQPRRHEAVGVRAALDEAQGTAWGVLRLRGGNPSFSWPVELVMPSKLERRASAYRKGSRPDLPPVERRAAGGGDRSRRAAHKAA